MVINIPGMPTQFNSCFLAGIIQYLFVCNYIHVHTVGRPNLAVFNWIKNARVIHEYNIYYSTIKRCYTSLVTVR